MLFKLKHLKFLISTFILSQCGHYMTDVSIHYTGVMLNVGMKLTTHFLCFHAQVCLAHYHHSPSYMLMGQVSPQLIQIVYLTTWYQIADDRNCNNFHVRKNYWTNGKCRTVKDKFPYRPLIQWFKIFFCRHIFQSVW